MKFTVSIRLSNTEGALERLLGRLRQRAFEISSMSAERTADRAFLDARFTIEGTRDVEPVIKQLAKCYEVQSLKFQYTEGGSAKWSVAEPHRKRSLSSCMTRPFVMECSVKG